MNETTMYEEKYWIAELGLYSELVDYLRNQCMEVNNAFESNRFIEEYVI